MDRTAQLLIGVVLTASIVFATPKPNRGATLLACMFAFMGAVSLISGRVIQQWHGGPPLTGTLGKLGSVILIAIGVSFILAGFFQRSDTDGKRDNREKT